MKDLSQVLHYYVSVLKKVYLDTPLSSVTSEIDKAEKAERALHIDLALASAQEALQGQCLTFREISEVSGLRMSSVQYYYESGLKKVEDKLRMMVLEELNVKK